MSDLLAWRDLRIAFRRLTGTPSIVDLGGKLSTFGLQIYPYAMSLDGAPLCLEVFADSHPTWLYRP